MKKAVLTVVALLLLCSMGFAQQVIKIGGIVDMTGGTGDVGGPYAEGLRDYLGYVNKNNLIPGKKIEYISVDYQYKIPQALAAYNDMVSKGVIAILGWGTGDTEAMAPKIANDKILYLSASYSEHLISEKTPYNFVGAATYSDQSRVALKWIKDNWKEKRAPKVALIYNDTGFGRSHLQDAEEYAKKAGIEIVDKEIVDLKALDATTQLLNMQKQTPDYAIMQFTTTATSTILKDAKKLGIKTKFIGLNWTFSEKLIQQAGDATEGYFAVMPFAFWHETNVPGVQLMHKVRKEMTGKEDAVMPVNYTQGFISAYILVEALKKAGNNLTGENIKKVLESNTFDLLGLCDTVAYKPGVKKPNASAKIYTVKQGKIVPVTGYVKY